MKIYIYNCIALECKGTTYFTARGQNDFKLVPDWGQMVSFNTLLYYNFIIAQGSG